MLKQGLKRPWLWLKLRGCPLGQELPADIGPVSTTFSRGHMEKSSPADILVPDHLRRKKSESDLVQLSIQG